MHRWKPENTSSGAREAAQNAFTQVVEARKKEDETRRPCRHVVHKGENRTSSKAHVDWANDDFTPSQTPRFQMLVHAGKNQNNLAASREQRSTRHAQNLVSTAQRLY